MDASKPVRLSDHAPWTAEKMGKATVFRSERLLLGLNAFEPGQTHAVHAHDGADKAYHVLAGRGTFTLGQEQHELCAGEVLVAPAGVPHGVVNDSPDRLLVLVAMAPAP